MSEHEINSLSSLTEVNKSAKKAGRPKQVTKPVTEKHVEEVKASVAEDTNVSKREEVKEISEEARLELHRQKKDARKRAMRDRELLALSHEQLERLDKQGKVAQLVNLENVEMYKSRGFDVLNKPEHHSSDEQYKQSGSSCEIPVSRDGSHRAVWMVTDKENRIILDEIREEDALKMDAQVGRIGHGGKTLSDPTGKLTKVKPF